MAGSLEQPNGIIGREAECRSLAGFLEAIPSGLTAFVIGGDAGIGKSTIWRAGCAQASDGGCQVLVSQPTAAEVRLSFAGLGDLLEPVIDDVLPALAVPQRHALEVALLRAEIEESPADERAVCVAFLRVVRLLSEQSAMILAVDDAHWLDRPTARVVDFALRRLADAPVGLLASVRLDARAPLALDLDRSVDQTRLRRLRLGPLSLAALHHLLLVREGAPLPRRTLLKVHEVSGGNPFFAIELARALAARDEPLTPRESLPIPSTLSELMAGRLAGVPAGTRKALLVASALAQPTASLVEAFDPRWRVGELLAKAERRGLIELDQGRIRFSHPLVASTVYASATSSERQQLHGRLAEVVTDPEERARHLALAAPGPDEQVATALEEAAGIAAARGAQDASAELCELAREATPRDRPGAARRRQLAAAEHYFAAGDWDRARALADDVIAAGASGPELARALHLLGKVSYYGNSFPEAAGLLRRALEHVGCEPADRAPIELDLAYVSETFEGFPAAAPHARAAREHAETLNEPGLLAESLAVVVITDFLLGHGLDRPTLERSLALEDRTRRVPVNLRPSMIAGYLMSWIGESAAACAMLDDLRGWLIDRGEECELPMLAHTLVLAECWHGNLAVAARHAREIADVATQLDTETARAFTLSGLATANAYLGNVEDAREQAEQSIELFERVGFQVAIAFPLGALGFLYLSLDEPVAADHVLRPLVSMLENAGLGEPSAVPFVFDELEALIGLGELPLAESLLETLEQRARALDRDVSLASAARCRGLLLAARGDLEGSLGALEHALDEHERLTRPVELARTLVALGQVQRRANRRRAARGTLERALAIFEQVGAAQWAQRTRGELARLGLRRRAGSELTPTEAQVARRASSGMTNREIAGVLFISPKTVEANLARVYRKLGITSRAQLGYHMAERERLSAAKE